MTEDGPLRWSPENAEISRNHPMIKEIRREMIKGIRPSACRVCYTEEDSGITSLRNHLISNFNFEPFKNATNPDGSIDTASMPLAYLDIRLGNLCNLKCRTCGPGDSSLWAEDIGELFQQDGKARFDFYGKKGYEISMTPKGWRINSDDFNYYEDGKFLEWMDEMISKGVERIYFTGGEPTLSKQHMNILDRIISSNRASTISLEYNSNMMAIPPKLYEQWSRFRSIRIGASIDAIGPLAGYIRHPSRWDLIERNCDIVGNGLFPNITASIATTISIFNVRHFPEISKWLVMKKYRNIMRRSSWHVVHNPPHMSIQCLPWLMKEVIEQEYIQHFEWLRSALGEIRAAPIIDHYRGIIRFMKMANTTDQLPLLKKTVGAIDRVRKESLESTIPWLASILKNVPD
jgi:MoaA/NifB/PqqE/SkfB family radical SAM enzyme